MLPAILGLGGLTAKIIATAVIPRVVRAISQSFSVTRPPEPCSPPAVEGISSAPEPAPAPVLSGISGTPISSRKWGYAGLWHHGPSGLDLATYRLYDAANRRWISRDPLGEGVDYNLYRYCGNDPVSKFDPSGLEPPPHMIDAMNSMVDAALTLTGVLVGGAGGGTGGLVLAGAGGPAAPALAPGLALAGRAAGATAGGAAGHLAGQAFGATTRGLYGMYMDSFEGAGANVLQSGGNTLRNNTARVLNDLLDRPLPARMWGRALERLKRSNSLCPDHHGKIWSNGDYTDADGKFIDNLLQYLFGS